MGANACTTRHPGLARLDPLPCSAGYPAGSAVRPRPSPADLGPMTTEQRDRSVARRGIGPWGRGRARERGREKREGRSSPEAILPFRKCRQPPPRRRPAWPPSHPIGGQRAARAVFPNNVAVTLHAPTCSLERLAGSTCCNNVAPRADYALLRGRQAIERRVPAYPVLAEVGQALEKATIIISILAKSGGHLSGSGRIELFFHQASVLPPRSGSRQEGDPRRRGGQSSCFSTQFK